MTHEHPESIGLRTLEDISGLILLSHDLQETLDNIVNLVAKRMVTDVCSIYLLGDDGETLTLQATKGLSKSAVGTVTMKTSEGLTGLVVEQRGVVNIENAPGHPRYKYFRKSREEKFTSFLGVPLFERKTPVGVIVVQTREARVFTQEEISTLATIAYQISSIVINAKLLDSVRRKEEERAFFQQELEKAQKNGGSPVEARAVPRSRKEMNHSLVGSPASPGFCWGKLFILNHRGLKRTGSHDKLLSRPEERKRFLVALEKTKIQTLYMEKQVAERLSKEDAAIFHTHLMILEDRGFIGRVMEAIDTDHGAVQGVLSVVEHYVAAFSQMEDPYLRQRAADMLDIGRRIVDCLEGNDDKRPRLRDKRIIVADEILPSDMATINTERVMGIITEKGDVNSHAAIMARSLGIPAVLGLGGLLKKINPRDEVIIDGTSGHIYINPEPRIRTEYERLQHDHSQRQKELEGLRDLPAVTTDGCKIYLRSNIGLLSDIRVAQINGAEGVGLYRTEFPYMTRKSFPDRTEQYGLYKRILEGFPGLPVNIRTLDIGGDKGLPYFTYPKEDNPFMGWRSIRVSLERQDIFREQLSAVLMAALHGNASLMFPMISGVDEIRQVKEILAEVSEGLKLEGIPHAERMKLGIMIEVPAAVQTAHILIREVDYFSIGTNDLIQYTLAADRNNPKVKQYYDAYHPAVLHAIKRVADVANEAGKSVSICGEMASNPLSAMLLLGMGINDFSLSAPAIPVVKSVLRKVSLTNARTVADHVLTLESASSIRAYLEIVRSELHL